MTIVPINRTFDNAKAMLLSEAEKAEDGDQAMVFRFRKAPDGTFDMMSECTDHVRQSQMAFAAAMLLRAAAE
jgi:hypothetical protein